MDSPISQPINMDDSRRAILLSVQKTLASQTEAMDTIQRQYTNDEESKDQLWKSLYTLFDSAVLKKSKIVLCGIGKSYKIATKLVATLNSLAIQACTLHPSEALHGDLGMLRKDDVLVFVTASGNTPELLNLLPHIQPGIRIILLTCSKGSQLESCPQVTSVLYAELPSHLKEEIIHGVPAPTVSASITLALADATILALSELIEGDVLKRKVSFSTNHPGGAIGADLSHLNANLLGQQQVSQQQQQAHHQAHQARQQVKQSTPTQTSSLHVPPRPNSRNASFTRPQSPLKKDLSQQTSATSLLGLGQIDTKYTPLHSQTGPKADGEQIFSLGSSASSDDDEDSPATTNTTQEAGSPLVQSAKIRSHPGSVLNVKESDFLACDRDTLLEWIAMYDYIVAERADGSKIAAESGAIRTIYRQRQQPSGPSAPPLPQHKPYSAATSTSPPTLAPVHEKMVWNPAAFLLAFAPSTELIN